MNPAQAFPIAEPPHRTWPVELARDIKLSHSIFALPLALLAAFMARSNGTPWPRFAAQLALVVGCMVSARTAAMLANRILDRRYDAENPRTARRALAAGRVRLRDAVTAWALAAALFGIGCLAFGVAFGNWWPAILALPVLLWICAYPLLKRFTALCHFYLGSSLAISPVAAAIAVDPATLDRPAIWLISLNVIGWVAGFDIIYALQDVEIDRRQRLFSLPSRVGVPAALWISRALHVLSIAALLVALRLDAELGALFAVGIVVAAALLLVEHAVTAGGATDRIQLAFFTINGFISLLLGALGIADVLTT